MLAIMKLAEKVRNNFKKAVDLLRLKFAFLKSRKKYALLFSAVLILAGIGLAIPLISAHAAWYDTVGDFIMNNIIYRIIYFVFWVLFLFAYWIAYLGAGFLNTTLNPEIMNQALNSSAIAAGWTIFRDIANLFFILILLFIAIGTIVRSQSYNLKNLLPKLIIAVFLINFSNVIAGVIIDFGNIFMYGVLKWMSCGAGNNTCASDFFEGLMDVIDGFDTKYKFGAGLTSPSAQDAIGMLIATVYTFLYGLILLALSTFLIIRTAAFALLIILSPLAFVGEVFPGLKEISSEWWDKLIKYVMFGPIFALLLYISGLIAQGTLITVSGPFWGSTNPNLGTFGELYVTIIPNIIPLIFLLAIIPITQKLGIAGANAILGATTGIAAFAGGFAGSYADRWLARGAGMKGSEQKGWRGGLSRAHAWTRRRLSNVSPGALKRAYKAQKADEEHDYDVATGAMRNKMDPYGAIKDKYGKWKDPNYKSSRPDYEKRAKDAKAELEFKAKGITNVDEMIDETKAMIEKGINPELSMKNFRWIAAEDGTDDLLERMGFERGAQGLSDLLQKYYDQKSSTGYKNLNDEHLSRFSSDISKAEKKNKSINYEGVGKFDTTAGGYVFNRMSNATEKDAQKADQIKAYNTLEERNRLRGTKGGNYVNRAGAATDTGIEMLRQVKGRDLDQVKGMARKDAQMVHDGLKSRFSAPTFVPATRTAPAHYNFSAGTPNDIKEVWNRIMIDKDIH